MSTEVTVELQQLAHAEGLALPAYQTADAAGLDLTAAVSALLAGELDVVAIVSAPESNLIEKATVAGNVAPSSTRLLPL